MTETGPGLSQWVIYDHPADYPHAWVARRWTVGARGVVNTGEVRTADSLDELREPLADAGLIMLTRSPDDDPTIVEVWT